MTGPTTFEHKPWVGEQYEQGLYLGHRYAILGYSHYTDDDDDSEDFTCRTLIDWRKWPSKPDRWHRFYNSIRSYFPGNMQEDFWDKVIFFNYLPRCVGRSDQKNRAGDDKELEEANDRFRRTIERERPHKILIFTSKAWQSLPTMREEDNGGKPLRLSRSTSFEWGTFCLSGYTVTAFGLKHPQFVAMHGLGNLTRCAVSEILEMPLSQ